MLTADQRALLTECKEFMATVPPGSWIGRPEWRDVLTQRINTTLTADNEQAEMIGGIKGVFTRWLSRK